MSLIGLLYWLSRIIAIGAIIHVVLDNRQPAKTMAWALVIYFVPYFGVIAYIFFGVNYRKERYISRRSMDMLTRRSMMEFIEQGQFQVPTAYKSIIDLFKNQSFSMPFISKRMDIITSGYEFFPQLLSDISQAKSHIHLCMYIFEDDALGRLVSDALIDKARQGVEVRVIYDDVGCWRVKKKFFERMRQEGIDVEPFMPVHFPQFTAKANYRNHRKIVVIDGVVGYVGGMNIALRYVKGTKHKKQQGKWRDTMVRIEGGAVNALQQAFLIDWYFVDRTLLSDRKYYTKPEAEGALMQMATSGPASPYPEIMQGYVRAILSARKYVYIETPYFLPTASVFFAMKTAAASGVDVRVMVPRHCDAHFVQWASHSYLREAVEAGIKVMLYEPGFLHSKLMVCDDAISTCGSTNADFRSFENNFEANMFFYDAAVAQRFKAVYLDDEAQSTAITSQSALMHPNIVRRLWDSLTRLLSPLL
ncbi:MAG: cardiolipin synthase [Prevotella sp.]|nr:cardiolipin synthase [Prevotella sp.]